MMNFSSTLKNRNKTKKMKLHTSERYYSFLSFENLSTERFLSSLMRFLNFPLNSALSLIGPFLIIGDWVQFNLVQQSKQHALRTYYSNIYIVPEAIVMAAAEVNPAVTGTEIKSMTNPEIN